MLKSAKFKNITNKPKAEILKKKTQTNKHFDSRSPC